MNIPADFPRGWEMSSLAGHQWKFSARRIGDHYVIGLTEEERRVRYSVCEELAQELAEVFRAKRVELPGYKRNVILARLRDAVDHKVRTGEWPITGFEVVWVMGRVEALVKE